MKRLVLVGAGHAHALVLRDLALAPLRGVDVTVVSPQPLAPYSGMVPGWLAGHYGFDDIVIDVARLAAAAGARWIEGEIDVLDAPRRRLRLAGGVELAYDLLSLNVGSTLRPPPTVHAAMLALRPLAELGVRYAALLHRLCECRSERPLVITAVGGGAAGFESLLAVLSRLRARQQRPVHASWVTRGTQALPGLSATAQRLALRGLHDAGVTVQLGATWCERFDERSDAVLWATGAQAHDWQCDALRRGALAVDEQGFIRIDEYLRSSSHPQIFASGDCASWAGAALPKAGVFAVRMGPVLAHNLRVALGVASPLRPYRPQRRHLVLLATGNGRAIASRGAFGAEGRWAWRWKHRIDRRFVDSFRHLPTAVAAGVQARAPVAPGSAPRSAPKSTAPSTSEESA